MSRSSLLQPAGGKAQHPLPKSQRPQVSVDAATVHRWKQDALDDVDTVLLDQQSWFYCFDDYMQQHEYRLVYDKPQVRGGGRVRPPDSQTVEFLCRLRLDRTLEEVVLGAHNKTNLEQRLAFAQICRDVCLDGALIELFEQETEEDPFHRVSIQWLAFGSPARQLLNYRDYLYFDFLFTTQDALGRRVLIDYRKSVDLKPDQLRDHGLDIVRSSTFMLTMHRMDGDKLISTVRGANQAGGSVPAWVSMKYLPIVLSRLLNGKGLAHSKALLCAGVRTSALAKRQSNGTLDCHSCRRKFSVTRRKAWCRACGRTVCRRCTRKLILPMDGDQLASSLPFVHTRFCHGCIMFAHSLLSKDAQMLDDYAKRLSEASDISFMSTDSFFGNDNGDDVSVDSTTSSSMQSETTDTPVLSASRLDRMLARLNLDSERCSRRRESSTDSSSESSQSLKIPIYADDGLRVFFPSDLPGDSRTP